MSKKLMRVQMVVDTIVYLEEDCATNCHKTRDILESIHDAILDGDGVNISLIDYSQSLMEQLPEKFRCGELVPENGGPILADIFRDNGVNETYLTKYPSGEEIEN